MVSEVSICNQALGWLGQNPIASLNDQSHRAQLCRDNYPHLRDTVLESRMWTFARARHLSETTDRDAWDSSYTHSMPNNWLKAWRVYRSILSNGNKIPDETWWMEQRLILSQHPKVYIQGSERITDTSKFSSMFSQALAARIAADLCIPITENRLLQADMWQLYNDKLEEAKTRDNQQGIAENFRSDTLITARATGVYDGYQY
jgi:hypothetical protein